MNYTVKTNLWKWSGDGAWYFLTIPSHYYQEIKMVTGSIKKGFGSVRVEASIGKSTWLTSIFPDTKSNTYLLPVKKSIRLAEGLEDGDLTIVELSLRDF
jgi:hypothetical protein